MKRQTGRLSSTGPIISQRVKIPRCHDVGVVRNNPEDILVSWFYFLLQLHFLFVTETLQYVDDVIGLYILSKRQRHGKVLGVLRQCQIRIEIHSPALLPFVIFVDLSP